MKKIHFLALCILISLPQAIFAQSADVIKQFKNFQTKDLLEANEEGFIWVNADDKTANCNQLSLSGSETPFPINFAELFYTPAISYTDDDVWIIGGSTYDKDIFTFYYTFFNATSGETIQETEKLFSVESKLPPSYRVSLSPDGKHIAISVIPVVKNINDEFRTLFLYSYNSNMDLQWRKEIEFENKKFALGEMMTCDNDDNIYVTNTSKSIKRNVTPTQEIVCYNESGSNVFKFEGIQPLFIRMQPTDLGITVVGTGFQQEGSSNISNNVFCKHLKPGTLEVEYSAQFRITDTTFQKAIKYKRPKNALDTLLNYMILYPIFDIYTFEDKSTAFALTQDTSSVVFIFFDSQGNHRDQAIVRHRFPMYYDFYAHQVDDRLYVLFNDVLANNGNIGTDTPEKYSSGIRTLPEEAGTYLVTLQPDSAPLKTQLTSYAQHDFIMKKAYTHDGETWLVYGTDHLAQKALGEEDVSLLLKIE